VGGGLLRAGELYVPGAPGFFGQMQPRWPWHRRKPHLLNTFSIPHWTQWDRDSRPSGV